MKKWLSILFATFLVLALFSGCSSSNSSSTASNTSNKSAGKIVIWTYFGQVKDLAAQFEKKYPKIKVDVKVFPGDQYQTKLLSALQSGTDVPDIFDLERGYIGKFIDSSFIQDLSAMGGNDLVKGYVPYVQELGRDSEGKLKAVADTSSPGAYWYIKANAKKWLGTDDSNKISQMVNSYDKIIALGEKINKESNGKVHLVSSSGDLFNIEAYNTQPFVKNGKLQIDPAWEKIYNTQKAMFNNNVEGKLDFVSAGWGYALNDGSVILTAMPAWGGFMVDNKDNKANSKFGIANTPKGWYMGGTYHSIYKNSPNKDLAYKFMQYVASKEWQTYNLKTTGNMPGLESVFKDNLNSFTFPMFGDENVLKPYFDMVKNIPAEKADKYGEDVRAKWVKIAGEGVKNNEDYNQVVKDFTQEVQNTFPDVQVK